MIPLRPLATLAAAAATAVAATLLGLAVGAARAAESLASAGATARLTVEYQYEAIGRREQKDELDDWQVRRSATVTAELVARKPQPMPTLQGLDGAQAARIDRQAAQVNKASSRMAPMMAGAEAILAKCGENEQCIERESRKMGEAMAGTPQLDATLRTGRETGAALQPDSASYQLWQPTGQSGRRQLAEQHHREFAELACAGLPGKRCTRDTKREGGGEWPRTAGGGALVEVDLHSSRLALVLPVPLDALGCDETVTTNEPGRKADQGTRPCKVALRVTSDGKITPGTPKVVALKGGWRSQSGEEIVKLNGALGEGGTLRIKWRFQVVS
jgi:hypothetical protein